MRKLIKILLFPITLILTILVNVSYFIVGGITVLLNIISFLLFIGSVIMFGVYFFGSGGNSELMAAIIIFAVSFLISPYGLPKLTAWLVSKVDDLNNLIKEI